MFKRIGRKLKIAILGVLIVAAAGAAFLFYRIQKYGPPNELQVHAMNPDGSGVRLLSRGISIIRGSVSWSSDGKVILFEKEGDICRMNADGSAERCLTNSAALDDSPKFSPDGTRIAFARDEDGTLSVWTMASDGSDASRLTKGDPDWGPFWSPDGTKIGFTSGRKGGPGIYLINSDGSGEKRFIKSKHESAGQFSEDVMGPWSPDGSTIAFESTRKGGPWIYLMKADGTDLRPFVGPRKGKDEDALAPAWSPDGRLIAFDRGLGSTTEIYVIKPDGTGERRLTNNGFADISPSWSPEGTVITFLSTRSL